MESFLDDYANLGADIFDDAAGDGMDAAETPIQETDPDLAPYILRSRAYWQQVPVPPDVPLAGTNLLSSLDDETLLGMSPTLLVHIQRSEASGGLQVVSPRAVTLGGIAARTGHEKRTPDMLLVGSAASRNLEWPTAVGTIPPHLFAGEPIDSYPADPAVRPKTVSTGLVPSSRTLSDPITRAFLTGRALVDLQRRTDVAGSGDALAAVIAKCWDLSPDSFEDMSEASLAPVGPLLRYAIRADDAYPSINAPVHSRKCVSVAANATGRQLYGELSAIDWRRLRVLAEAVFLQATRLEGHTLASMALEQPPGNPRASPTRRGILQFRPLPGSIWYFGPETFRLDMAPAPEAIVAARVPQRVRDAVIRYHEDVRPIARAHAAGAEVSYSRTLQVQPTLESGETIISGYRTLLKVSSTAQARGKTAVAAVRSFVYSCMADATDLPTLRAVWMCRGMQKTVESMSMGHLLDVTTSRHVAARMGSLPSDLRARLSVEAGRRGADLADWWEAFSAQLPAEIQTMKEGSGAWAIGIAHLLIHPPTDKWHRLTDAMSHQSHAVMARAHLHDVKLPAMLRSAERSFQAGLAVARQLGESYGAYYAAMHDVASVLAGRMRRGGNLVAADKLTLAGQMWDIRAKAAATVSLHSNDGTPATAGEFRTAHGMYHLRTAPYPAYHRWHRTLNASRSVTVDTKARFPHHGPARISDAFSDVTEPLFRAPPGSSCRLMRYAERPAALGRDIESTLAQICTDTHAVMSFYDCEGLQETASTRPARASGQISLGESIDVSRYRPAPGTYWDLIAEMEPLEASDLVDAVTRMDHARALEIETADYAHPDELRAAVWGAQEEESRAAESARDAVV